MWLEAEKARNFNAVVWVLGEVNGYPAELRSLMDHAVQRAAHPVPPKAALLEEARPLPEQDLKRFREPTDEALRIKPDDPWNVVAGKAQSRRVCPYWGAFFAACTVFLPRPPRVPRKG